MESAIQREKALKEWHRAWKLNLIETLDPDWKDWYASICWRDHLMNNRHTHNGIPAQFSNDILLDALRLPALPFFENKFALTMTILLYFFPFLR